MSNLNAIQLLIDIGVMTEEDARHIRVVQVEAILKLMMEKQALLPKEVPNARSILQELVESTNQTKQLMAKMSLVQIITNNIHRRMKRAGDALSEQKQRVTTGNWPVVTATSKGG